MPSVSDSGAATPTGPFRSSKFLRHRVAWRGSASFYSCSTPEALNLSRSRVLCDRTDHTIRGAVWGHCLDLQLDLDLRAGKAFEMLNDGFSDLAGVASHPERIKGHGAIEAAESPFHAGIIPAKRRKPTRGFEPRTPSLRVYGPLAADLVICRQIWCPTQDNHSVERRRTPRPSRDVFQRCSNPSSVRTLAHSRVAMFGSGLKSPRSRI